MTLRWKPHGLRPLVGSSGYASGTPKRCFALVREGCSSRFRTPGARNSRAWPTAGCFVNHESVIQQGCPGPTHSRRRISTLCCGLPSSGSIGLWERAAAVHCPMRGSGKRVLAVARSSPNSNRPPFQSRGCRAPLTVWAICRVRALRSRQRWAERGGGFSYVAHTEGVHPDELLAFALYGGERVPVNQVAGAARAFTERNPSYAPGWWRALVGPA